ncbi:hypothetical protein P344_01235 [Spiroplasma mirum ATCC 29335]|uniref:Uncharacterized protein n=1 Tax=Spiroplasma mirum ATCC 29335 TaxID=838561 RepID=W6AKB3_9MOLU|nr:hypothetical protein [Spiroplasma mirum]AHI57612.1 hypothetical protein P344_01235 [Spiroplasma mirum ATCC 29335]
MKKKWLYKDTLYNWIDLLKLLYRQNIIYYQVQWRSSKEGRIGYLPNGELIKRVKFKEMEKLLDD